MRLPIDECGWREVGNRLHDAMCGSDMEVYYSLLCHVERRVQEDKARIKPDKPHEPVLSDPDDMADVPAETPPLPTEKVADMTHRGSGL
jgi:hypothetical protein